jgi:methyltransferase (TIGR00027 family)
VIDDPYAIDLLEPSMRGLYEVARRWPRLIPTLEVTLAGLASRVRHHDAVLSAAIGDGVRQVVIVGAGFDTRAWRFAADGMQFFELDHPATQHEKVRRARVPGPTFVAADLTVDSAAAELRRTGLDVGQPTVSVVEGVTMYLAEEVVRRVFTDLAEISAPGSRLATDFYPPSSGSAVPHRRQRLVQRLARAGSGEGLRFVTDRAGAVDLVESCGWRVDRELDEDMVGALVPAGSGLPVDSVDRRKTLLSATV